MKLSIAALSAAVLFAGCGKDVVDEPVIGETGASEVNFTTSVACTGGAVSSGPGSKASVPLNGKVIELKSRDGKIKMQMTHEVLPYIVEMPEGASASLTKGELINETGTVIPLPADKVGNTFKVAAWTGTDSFIPADTGVTYNQSTGKWSTASPYVWKRGEEKTFVAYANLPSATGAASVEGATSAGGQTLTYDVSVVPTASAQKDILMGCYKGDGNNSGTADIRFYHPLTAVKFVAGQLEDITSINSISIKGVYTSGTAAQSADGNGVISFEWTPAIGSTTEVRQEFSTPIAIPITGDDKTLGEAFLLIPQNLSSASVEVTINATIKKTGSADPDKVDLTATIDGGSWEAGKINVYTVAYARLIKYALPSEFSVSDDDGATIKKVRFSQGNLRYSVDNLGVEFL